MELWMLLPNGLGFTKICNTKNTAKKQDQIYGVNIKFVDKKGNDINIIGYIAEYIRAVVDKY